MERRHLFPGYVFIRSDMCAREVHDFVLAHRRDVWTFIRELGIYERKAAGQAAAGSGGPYGEEAYEVRDLTGEEEAYLDRMLDGEGVIRMSAGYCEGGKYVVMEGPLKAYEGRIADVDRHNRMAYLDFRAMGRVAKAGMELKPKRHWFPGETGTAVLLDGTEVDVRELKKRMMGG